MVTVFLSSGQRLRIFKIPPDKSYIEGVCTQIENARTLWHQNQVHLLLLARLACGPKRTLVRMREILKGWIIKGILARGLAIALTKEGAKTTLRADNSQVLDVVLCNTLTNGLKTVGQSIFMEAIMGPWRLLDDSSCSFDNEPNRIGTIWPSSGAQLGRNIESASIFER